MVDENEDANQGLSPGLRKVLVTVPGILGSLSGIIVVSRFVQQNSTLIACSVGVLLVMIGAVWFMSSRRLWRVLTVVGCVFAAALLLLWVWVASTEIAEINVTITEPQADSVVGMSHVVKGEVSDPGAQVIVLVRPLATSEMWVQKRPIVGADGSWQTSCLFGTETLGTDEQYQVIALATKENFLVNMATGNNLRVGQTLTKLPQNTNKSAAVTVRRLE